MILENFSIGNPFSSEEYVVGMWTVFCSQPTQEPKNSIVSLNKWELSAPIAINNYSVDLSVLLKISDDEKYYLHEIVLEIYIKKAFFCLSCVTSQRA